MQFIKNLFGGSSEPKEEKILPWQALTTTANLDTIDKKSVAKTQLIFKHSTRCGISKMVLNQFVTSYNLDLSADLYYLDLLNYRALSDEIGYRYQVLHESPQLLIIRNGVAVAHASHGAINDLHLEKYV
ncbi:bacillithiol system redox-active protein YtxJ [Bizionia sediminis]|uniref:Bacillithiol system redox-active protein YtxJ n=1 Tax=Bizionia sediminis TaxID=1737064 RepID=A0ABW5KT43_9FLAO